MASPRSGLGTQFGYSVAETTYGTAVAATRFRRVRSASLTPKIGISEGASIQAGLRSPIGAHRVQTTISAEGSVEFDATYRDMGLLLQAVFGKTSTSALKTGTAYEQVHTLDNEDYGLSHTFQVSRIARSAAGTAIPATMTGGKVTAASFSCEVSGVLEVGLTLDGRQFDNTTALAVASYLPVTPRVRGVDMCVKVGTFGAEAAIQGVRSWSMNYSRPMDTEDHTACNAGLKAEPVQNGPIEVTGTLKSGGRATEKTADGGRRAVTKGHHIQLGIYTLMAEQASGERLDAPAEIIGLQTTKEAPVATGEVADVKTPLLGTEEHPGLIQIAARMLKDGIFPPNPKSMLCSAKYCPAYGTRCHYHD